MSRLAIRAPWMEPRPPTTTTTNKSMIMVEAMAGLVIRYGPPITPAKPASQAPIPNSSRKTSGTLKPKALTMRMLATAARTMIPALVLNRTKNIRMKTSTETARMNRR